jgi:FkbM family methyltransferase
MNASGRGKPPEGNNTTMKLTKILIALATIALCLAIGNTLWPPLGMFLLIAAGRAPDCSALGAAKAAERRYLYQAAERRILRDSHVGKRGQEPYVLTETPRGRFWEPFNGNGGSEVLAQIVEIESKYAVNAPEPVHRGDVVLDCGANVGMFTREALNRGARLVVAIEPVPINLECLRRNLRAEIASGQVIVYPKGVWDKDDVLILNESENSSAEDSFVRTENAHAGASLPLTTIDKLVEELKLDRVDMIKMDIEGSEPKALLGAQQTLKRFRPRLEVEVSGNAKEIRDIARRAWPSYRSECLVCTLDPDHRMLIPSMINVYP